MDISIFCELCGEPILFAETSQNKNKVAASTVAIANNLDIPAFRIHYTKTATGLSSKASLYEYENKDTSAVRNNVRWITAVDNSQAPRLHNVGLDVVVSELQGTVAAHMETHDQSVVFSST